MLKGSVFVVQAVETKPRCHQESIIQHVLCVSQLWIDFPPLLPTSDTCFIKWKGQGSVLDLLLIHYLHIGEDDTFQPP